ncbi:hypothetical protein EDC04DRAFT_462783 [Pisolithus marmoratus]|nr:hypothetical protein EDC04DRAFT_462783 [Pisolithus marmoratus]
MSLPSSNSSTGTPPWTKELLRKLLFAEDINDVHFHMFARRSKLKALDSRVLNANTALLENSSKYFADLFSSNVISPSTAMMNVEKSDEIFDGIDLSEYGYESDSDLEDDTDIVVSPSQTQVIADSDNDNEDLDTCVPTEPTLEEGHDFFQQNVSGLSFERPAGGQPNGVLCGLGGGRHIFIKDGAFRTWYCLLHFLYTGTAEFAPLRSSGKREPQGFPFSATEEPKCSPKSMYRLAAKLNIEELRDRAIAFIRSNIDESNLLQELETGFTRRHPAVLEMELDLLSEKVASPLIVEGLPKLMTRIADKELPHGAGIIVGLHMRILQKHYSYQLLSNASSFGMSGNSGKKTRGKYVR